MIFTCFLLLFFISSTINEWSSKILILAMVVHSNWNTWIYMYRAWGKRFFTLSLPPSQLHLASIIVVFLSLHDPLRLVAYGFYFVAFVMRFLSLAIPQRSLTLCPFYILNCGCRLVTVALSVSLRGTFMLTASPLCSFASCFWSMVVPLQYSPKLWLFVAIVDWSPLLPYPPLAALSCRHLLCAALLLLRSPMYVLVVATTVPLNLLQWLPRSRCFVTSKTIVPHCF
jgi:hypothetical protein